MNTTQNTKQHSSDFKLITEHEKGAKLPILKFNLEEWEIANLETSHKRVYEKCVLNQLNIRFTFNIGYRLGNTSVSIPTFSDTKRKYQASLDELLNPYTIIPNYHEFVDQFYATHFGKISYRLNGFKNYIKDADNVIDVIREVEEAYVFLIKLFKEEQVFTELHNHKHSYSMYLRVEQIFSLWETGLCFIIDRIRNVVIKNELEKLIAKHCPEGEYFKDNEGFLKHYGSEKINLEACIEACEVRLELINLIKEDLNLKD